MSKFHKERISRERSYEQIIALERYRKARKKTFDSDMNEDEREKKHCVLDDFYNKKFKGKECQNI